MWGVGAGCVWGVRVGHGRGCAGVCGVWGVGCTRCNLPASEVHVGVVGPDGFVLGAGPEAGFVLGDGDGVMLLPSVNRSYTVSMSSFCAKSLILFSSVGSDPVRPFE